MVPEAEEQYESNADESKGLDVPTKLTLAFTSLIALGTISVLLIYLWGMPVNAVLEQTEQVRVPTATASANARAALLEMTSTIRAYISLSDPRLLDKFREAQDRFDAELTQLDGLLRDTNDVEAKQKMQELKSAYADWEELPRKIIDMHDNPEENQEALYTLLQTGEPRIKKVQEGISGIIEEQANREAPGQIVLLKQMADFRYSFTNLVAAIRGYVGTARPSYKELYYTSHELNNVHWQRLNDAKDAMSPTQRVAFDRLDEPRATFLAIPEEWIFPAIESKSGPYQDRYMLRTSAAPLAEKMDGLLNDVVKDQNERLQHDVRQSSANLQQLWWQTISTTILTIVIGASLAFVFRKMIIRDINRRREAEAAAQAAQKRLLEIEQAAHERVQTELNQAHAELVRSTRLATIGQMSAQVAHDIRNPLGAVRNAAYYLKRKVPANQAKWGEYLQLIEEEVDVCAEIIQNLLEITRVKEPSYAQVDLQELVTDSINRLSLPSAVQFNYTADQQPTMVVADPIQLRQVIDNLLKNALDAVQDQGSIAVSAKNDGEYWNIDVQNNGPGIPESERDAIFELFHTTKAKGTGLGLPICRQLLERHGGDVELVESTTSGTAFRVRLPIQAFHDKRER